MKNRIIIDGGHTDFDRIRDVTPASIFYVRLGQPFYDIDGVYHTAASAGDCTHNYDRDTATFVESEDSPQWTQSYEPYFSQSGGSSFDVHFDTANIMFDRESRNDSAIRLFVKAAVSICGMKVRYASDGNYEFSASAEKDTGAITESAAWSNDDLYFMGSRRFVVRKIEVQERNALCVKFRVECAYPSIDDFRVYAVEMRSSGMSFDHYTGE